MLHVILLILKIIGIIVAVIIGLLLLIILSVLFIPIRYKVSGKKYDQLNGMIRLYWFFHILSTYAAYENGEIKFYVKVFGFTLFDDKTEEISSDNKGDDNRNEIIEEEYEEITIDVDSREHEQLSQETNILIHKQNNININDVTDDTLKIQSIEKSNESTQTRKSKKKTIISKKLKVKKTTKKFYLRKHLKIFLHKITTGFNIFLYKIKLLFIKIRNTIKGIGDRTIRLYNFVSEKVKFYQDNINTQENKELLKFLWAQVKVLLKHLKPKRYRIYVKFGTPEPDVTGKILAYTSIANSFLNLKLDLVPVFDENVFEGEIFLKGRIRVITLLLIAFRVYRNKQFRIILKKFI